MLNTGFGYFPTYTLGNVLSIQFYQAALTQTPGLEAEVGDGNYSGLLGWLKQNVYQHGKIYPPKDLIMRATGRELSAQPYLDYLRQKFGELYELK
jgi:carboxypeptidase Taq